MSQSHRIDYLRFAAKMLGIPFEGETDSVYMARAVSSVLPADRMRLEDVFAEAVSAVRAAHLTPKLPAELSDTLPGQVNPANHKMLLEARVVMPLTYAVSDGRGWEMGFSYCRKLLVPLVLPDQKINLPTIRLPFQIPVVFRDSDSLTGLLTELVRYDPVEFGTLQNGPTVIGYGGDVAYDLRVVADKFMEVIPWLS